MLEMHLTFFQIFACKFGTTRPILVTYANVVKCRMRTQSKRRRAVMYGAPRGTASIVNKRWDFCVKTIGGFLGGSVSALYARPVVDHL